MAGKSHPARLFIEVLQNGFPVCSHSLGLRKRAVVTLGTDSKATLTLPHYPLPARVELLRIDKKGVHVEARADWEGFVTSNGEVIHLGHGSSEVVTLRKADYGTLYYGDLQILIRLGQAHSVNIRKEKRRCQPTPLSLAFYSPQELGVMVTAAVVALLVLIPVLYWLISKQHDRPQSLTDLRAEYVTSFMYPEHFATIPEALQEHLDRRSYPLSTITYYQSIAQLIIGWPIAHAELLFESSKDYFGALHDERRETIRKYELNQNDFEVGYLAKPETSLIDIAAVRGESARTSALRLFDKLDLHHESLHEQLEKRRATKIAFEDIPEFNAENYKNSKSPEEKAAERAAKEKLAKISPFHMESDEANMYRIAKDWAEQTELRRKTIVLHSAPKVPLVDPDFREVYIPRSMNFASFLQKAAVLADEDKLASLQASQYGVTPSAKIKEPLIGEIDPKLIQKTVEENWQSLRLCYELALRRDKKIAGEMEWRWRIDSRGEISDIELVNSTIGDNRMLTCVKSKLNAWRFPPPRRGSVEVRYPFRFSQTKG